LLKVDPLTTQDFYASPRWRVESDAMGQ